MVGRDAPRRRCAHPASQPHRRRRAGVHCTFIRSLHAHALTLPQCGGAHNQSRKRALRRRRNTTRRKAGPSNLTGAQTEKKGKPGRRIRGDAKFVGDGKALNQDLAGDAKSAGTGFRKKAARCGLLRSFLPLCGAHVTGCSKSAREARAAAAEARLARLAAGPSAKPEDEDGSDEDEDEDEGGMPVETNDDRRQMLLDSMRDADEDDALELLRTANGQRGLVTCGGSEPPRKKAKLDPQTSAPSTSQQPTASQPPASSSRATPRPLAPSESSSIPAKRKQTTMLQDEVDTRKREALGLGQARTLGSAKPLAGERVRAQPGEQEWACSVCTLWVADPMLTWLLTASGQNQSPTRAVMCRLRDVAD